MGDHHGFRFVMFVSWSWEVEILDVQSQQPHIFSHKKNCSKYYDAHESQSQCQFVPFGDVSVPMCQLCPYVDVPKYPMHYESMDAYEAIWKLEYEVCYVVVKSVLPECVTVVFERAECSGMSACILPPMSCVYQYV